MASQEFLTIKQVAERYAVSTMHIRRMCERKEFPKPLRFGKALRWSIETLREADRERKSE